MNKELQEKLYKKYPKIFAQKDLSIKESCMSFGIECGDGWYKLIDNLCSMIQFHIDNNNFEQIEAVQVKEKFGDLRFYTTNHREYIAGIIEFAESLSSQICETCGSMEDITKTKGLIKTICKKCLKEKK